MLRFQRYSHLGCDVMYFLCISGSILGEIGCPYLRGMNPLNAELNPICQLLALLGAHHILHVSRIRVKVCRAERRSLLMQRKDSGQGNES